MYLPRHKSAPMKKLTVSAFGGYRHDHMADAAQPYDMQNLTSDAFPLLSTRKKRGQLASLQAPNGIWAKGKLLYADGASLYYDGAVIGSVTNSEKQFASIGSSVLIWPDKLKYDTAARTLTSLSNTVTTSSAVTFSMCNLQGDAYSGYTVSGMPPETPSAGDMWLDTQDVPHVLKRYSAASSMWVSVAAAYIRIACPGIGAGFADYDGVRISGCANDAFNTSALLYAANPDWLLVAGTLDAAFTQDAPLTIAREIPDFDFLCVKDNRVWGCSNDRREIACCKLGDPANWSSFMGISTDSYTVSVGDGGDFTGCCAYGGNVLFFKEDRLLKLLGSKPENYQLNAVLCAGVCEGSHKSLAVAGGMLFYHGRNGIYAYGGALPEYVGAALGESFQNAVGGGWDDKYYVSMQTGAGAWRLFAYDTRYGLWHREDDAHALGFAALNGDMLMLLSDGRLYSLSGEGAAEADVSWFAETGELIAKGHARPQRLLLRLSLAEGAGLRALLSYDGGGFVDAGYLYAARKRPVNLPLRLRRCDSLRLRLEGTGETALHALYLFWEEGSE